MKLVAFLKLIRWKNIEDINGDYKLKMSTLPILIEKKRVKQIASLLCIIPLTFLLYIVIKFASIYKITALYLVLFTIITMLYVLLKLRVANSTKDFKIISVF